MCTAVKYVTRTSKPGRHSDGEGLDHGHAPDAANRRDADEERIESESQNLEKYLGLKVAYETDVKLKVASRLVQSKGDPYLVPPPSGKQ